MRSDLALITHVALKSVELVNGYYLSEWIGADPKNRDRWRVIQAIRNRAPFSLVVPEDSREIEYRHGGRLAEGLAAAHLSDGLAVSLRVDDMWELPWLSVDRSILAESPTGTLELIEEQIEIRHAAADDHLGAHASWVRTAGHDGLTSGALVWDQRRDFFPHLTFLPRVESDLRDLPPEWTRPVVTLLLRLEEAVASWLPGHENSPNWQTKITSESESRRARYCTFDDMDGIARVFELHGRFTPGAGRVHFRIVSEDGTARIAYIGRKLGA